MKPIYYSFQEDSHTYLILDLQTFDVKYYDKNYLSKIDTELQGRLNLSNLQMCVVLDSLHNYKEKI